jgi:HEPN domain-containing protein
MTESPVEQIVQQTVEKLLKAFVVFHGQQPHETHDLVARLGECLALDPTLSDLSGSCEALNAYSVGARYLCDIFELGEVEGRLSVRAGEDVRAAVLKLLA